MNKDFESQFADTYCYKPLKELPREVGDYYYVTENVESTLVYRLIEITLASEEEVRMARQAAPEQEFELGDAVMLVYTLEETGKVPPCTYEQFQLMNQSIEDFPKKYGQIIDMLVESGGENGKKLKKAFETLNQGYYCRIPNPHDFKNMMH